MEDAYSQRLTSFIMSKAIPQNFRVNGESQHRTTNGILKHLDGVPIFNAFKIDQ